MDRNDSPRTAIGLMASRYADGPDSSQLTARYLAAVLEEGGVDELSELICSLVDLCGLLLERRCMEQHIAELATLREIASSYSRDGPGRWSTTFRTGPGG